LRVNVEDGAEGSALKSRYGASALPTTLVLTPKMVLVEAIQGFAPRASYIRRLDEALRDFEKDQQELDSLMAQQDPELWRSLADDLHRRGDGQRAAELYQRLLDRDELPAEERTFLLFRLADAQRLNSDYDGALRSLHESRRRAEREGNGKMVEAVDFLRIQISQDRGPCSATLAALQAFLENHPKSDHRRQARRSLDLLLHQECT
jgi:tetratricopeptide (TPR) repeat protein